MESDDWTVYNGLIAAAKYDPVTHHLHFNEAALHLLKLPSSTGLAEFFQVLRPLCGNKFVSWKTAKVNLLLGQLLYHSQATGFSGLQLTLPQKTLRYTSKSPIRLLLGAPPAIGSTKHS